MKIANIGITLMEVFGSLFGLLFGFLGTLVTLFMAIIGTVAGLIGVAIASLPILVVLFFIWLALMMAG